MCVAVDERVGVGERVVLPERDDLGGVVRGQRLVRAVGQAFDEPLHAARAIEPGPLVRRGHHLRDEREHVVGAGPQGP